MKPSWVIFLGRTSTLCFFLGGGGGWGDLKTPPTVCIKPMTSRLLGGHPIHYATVTLLHYNALYVRLLHLEVRILMHYLGACRMAEWHILKIPINISFWKHLQNMLSSLNPRNRYLPGLPAPEYSRAPPKRYWRNKHGPIYVCIGPYAKLGSETGLSNIFKDLRVSVIDLTTT